MKHAAFADAADELVYEQVYVLLRYLLDHISLQCSRKGKKLILNRKRT